MNIQNIVADWLAQYVGPNMEGLMFLFAVGFCYPFGGLVIFLATLDFSLVILGISLFSLIAGGVGLVMALAGVSLFPIWLPDFIQLLIIGVAALVVFFTWRRVFSDVDEVTCR